MFNRIRKLTMRTKKSVGVGACEYVSVRVSVSVRVTLLLVYILSDFIMWYSEQVTLK